MKGRGLPIWVLSLALMMLGSQIVQAASARQARQFVPIMSYRVGPYAAGGSGLAAGYIDYLQLINERDGGVNGVLLAWEECETEYNNARGVECYERLKTKGATGTSIVVPLSTGIAYSLIEKVARDKIPMITIGYGRTDTADGRVFPYVFPLITTYWSQATGIVKFLAMKEGNAGGLAGKRIVHLYHDSAYGKEPVPILQEMSRRYGYELVTIPVAHPGNEQHAQWLRIRHLDPDWVILWGWGVMNPTALKTAAKVGFPREKMVGVWWSGAEEDTIPAGAAATGFLAATYSVSGTDHVVIRDVMKHVYAKGNGNMKDRSRVGSIYYNRGIVTGIVVVEAIGKAQERFGKRPLTGEELRWGIENLHIDDMRLAALGATGFMPPLNVSCADHEGSGQVKFQQWDGEQWKILTGWIEPHRDLVRARIEDSAAKYAKENDIVPRNCADERAEK